MTTKELLRLKFPAKPAGPPNIIGDARYCIGDGIDVMAAWRAYGGSRRPPSQSTPATRPDPRLGDDEETIMKTARHESHHAVVCWVVCPDAQIHSMEYRPASRPDWLGMISYTLPATTPPWPRAIIRAAGTDGDYEQLVKQDGIVLSEAQWRDAQGMAGRIFWRNGLLIDMIAGEFAKRDLTERDLEKFRHLVNRSLLPIGIWA